MFIVNVFCLYFYIFITPAGAFGSQRQDFLFLFRFISFYFVLFRFIPPSNSFGWETKFVFDLVGDYFPFT